MLGENPWRDGSGKAIVCSSESSGASQAAHAHGGELSLHWLREHTPALGWVATDASAAREE